MSNAAKIGEFLNEAKVFYFLTVDGDQPKGRPFGFYLIEGDRIYFGCGTFKNVFRQLTANPKVEVLALLEKVRAAMPDVMGLYDKNGWEMGLFYLENGHAEIRGLFDVIEEFDV